VYTKEHNAEMRTGLRPVEDPLRPASTASRPVAERSAPQTRPVSAELVNRNDR